MRNIVEQPLLAEMKIVKLGGSDVKIMPNGGYLILAMAECLADADVKIALCQGAQTGLKRLQRPEQISGQPKR